jgi:hypothetical protein
MFEDITFWKQAISVVGSVEMIKSFTKGLKVPGFVWVLLTIAFCAVYSLPFVIEHIDVAALASVCTLFYDAILKRLKTKFSEKAGGENE